MACATAQQLTQTVAHAVAQQDGDLLAAAVRLDLGNTSLLTQLATGSLNLEALCGTALSEPYDEMLLEHMHFLRATHAAQPLEAYSHCERATACFHAVFEKDTAWSLPALHALHLNLRLAAARADRELVSRGEKEGKLQEAARILQRAFQTTVTDRSPLEVRRRRRCSALRAVCRDEPCRVFPCRGDAARDPTAETLERGWRRREQASKKWGALGVINTLFKIYFQIQNLRLCQNLIRAVEGPAFPKALDGQAPRPLSPSHPPRIRPGPHIAHGRVISPHPRSPQVVAGRSFPKAQLVTYKYFLGRLSLLNSQAKHLWHAPPPAPTKSDTARVL